MTLQAWSQGTKPISYTQKSCTHAHMQAIPLSNASCSPPRIFLQLQGNASIVHGGGAETPELAPEPAKAQPVQGNTASALKHLADTRQVHVFHRQGWGTVPSLHHVATVQRRDPLSVGRRKCSPLESTARQEQTVLLKCASGQRLQHYCQDHAFLLLDSVCLQRPHCSL